MKEHTKKIGEGFKGLMQDLRKHVVHISYKIHHFLGKTGRIIVGAVILIRILLAVYTHRIERARFAHYDYEIVPYRSMSFWNDDWIREMHRDMQRMQERMERTRAYYDKLFSTTFNFPSNKANYQKYFWSDSEKGTYSLTYQDGKINGFVEGGDEQKLSSLSETLQHQGLHVDKNAHILFFSGEVKDLQSILSLLQQ